jgi:hypothetical protein
MGTKSNPGEFDCYKNALPDEPMFHLLGRDPDFARLVNEWADRRWRDVQCGDRPESDLALVDEARATAVAGAKWRRENMGAWRVKPRPTVQELEANSAVSIAPDGSVYADDHLVGRFSV